MPVMGETSRRNKWSLRTTLRENETTLFETDRLHPVETTLLRIAKVASGYMGDEEKRRARRGILSSVFSILLIETPNTKDKIGYG